MDGTGVDTMETLPEEMGHAQTVLQEALTLVELHMQQ